MSENPHDQRSTTTRFGGVNQAVDTHDLPPGVWEDARNLLTSDTGDEQRTRNGFARVTNKLFAEPFAILPGAAGGRFDGGLVGIPTTDPAPSYANGTLRLVATPATPPALEVPIDITFTAYGGVALGISTYNWDIDVNAGPTTDYTGSSTSIVHNYTVAGTYLVRVWGTGGDGLEYEALVTVVLIDADNLTPAPIDFPPPPPPPPPPPDDDDDEPPTIAVWGVDELINLGESSDLHYQTTNAVTVAMDGNILPNVNGIIIVTPIVTTTYIFDAFGPGGIATDRVTIVVDPTPPPAGFLRCDDAPYVMVHDVEKDCEVFAYAVGQQGVLANYPELPPTLPLPVLSQIGSIFGTTLAQTGPTIDAADFSPAIWALTATLPVGIDYDEIEIVVEAPGTEIIPTTFKLAVVREFRTMTINVCNDLNVSTPSVFGKISEPTCIGQAHLSMYYDDGGVDVTFASDVEVVIVPSAGEPATPTFLVTNAADALEFSLGAKVAPNKNIIPAAAFSGGEAGEASCSFDLTFQSGSLNTLDDAYCTVQFVATEYVNLEGLR